jgi:hypothetical protein
MTPFIEFATKNFKVFNPAKGLIPFEAHNFNINLSKIIDKERFVLVKKYRQAGFSVFAELWALYECMHKENQRIMITYKTDGEICREVGSRFRTTVQNIPDEIHPKFVRFNEHTIELKNGSSIYLRTPEQARGCSCNAVIFDEFAFWNKDEHYAAMLPTISTGGKLIIGSSTNGTKNMFYKLWMDYDNSRYFRYAPWWGDHPDFPIERAAELKKQLGEKGWRTSYECEFID